MDTNSQDFSVQSPTARMFAYHVNMSEKSQVSVAAHAGYSRPNVISMLKAGKMKIPVEKIPAFAEALGIDPAPLLRSAMAEYFPGIWSVLQQHLSKDLLVSSDEQHVLNVLREHSGLRGVKVNTERQKAALMALAETLTPKAVLDELVSATEEDTKH